MPSLVRRRRAGHSEGRVHDDAKHGGHAGAETGGVETADPLAGQALLVFLVFMGAALVGCLLLMLERILQAVGNLDRRLPPPA